MMNRELINAFTHLESEIAREKGAFVLFALFLREDLPDRWDLIVSAPWITDRKAALDYFVAKIQSQIGAAVLTDLSRIIFADPDDEAVQSLNRAMNIEHGAAEVRDSNFFGLQIRHAFIITSKRPKTTVTG